MKYCVTAANSSVGRNLLRTLEARHQDSVLALVRSSTALAGLPVAPHIDSQVLGFHDLAGLTEAFRGADSVIHLAGILFEGKNSRYQQANVDSTAAVVNAAQQAGVRHLLFISVLGADAASPNPYYRSKGEAELLVTGSGLAATVLRTPLLLGHDTAGGQALLREANADTAKVLGGGRQLVRPLDVDDLCAAILAACDDPQPGAQVLELCGPEAVPYRELVQRLAHKLGLEVTVAGIPVALAKLLAGIGHALRGAGMSPAIIDVITSAEQVRENADTALGIALTPLAATLDKLAERKLI